MDPGELRRLLSEGETYTIEFKVDVNDDELVQTAVCLANGDGGVLVLGVQDDGTPVGARPRHGDRTEPARLAALVANKTTPSLVTDITAVSVDSHELTVIVVPRATGLVATSNGVYLRRAVDTHGRPQCLPLQPHEAVARLATLGEQDISALAVPAADEDSLDLLEIRRFQDLARSQGDSLLAELSHNDLLAALGLRTLSGDLTVGALLMFGTVEALRAYVPTHEFAFQVVDQLEVRVNRIEHGPLVRAMSELADAVAAYNPEDEVEVGLLRIPLPRYADTSVRETIANALVHRNYALNGQVRVAIEDGTLSITSPGTFPEGITAANVLVAPPVPRNPRIADAFKRAGLVERTGRGVARVWRSQLALGRPAPDYSRTTSNWVEVRLRTGPADKELAAFIAQAERSGQQLDLHYLQVLHEVRRERRITSPRAAELMQISHDEARAVLNELVERGLLEARGERKGRTYHLAAGIYRELGDASSYVRTRGFDRLQQEQMLVTYVREHGPVSRSDAAALCQLDPDQASRLLRSMAKRGLLQMTGQRRGARYGIPES